MNANVHVYTYYIGTSYSDDDSPFYVNVDEKIAAAGRTNDGRSLVSSCNGMLYMPLDRTEHHPSRAAALAAAAAELERRAARILSQAGRLRRECEPCATS
jgi:hypothetical protein